MPLSPARRRMSAAIVLLGTAAMPLSALAQDEGVSETPAPPEEETAGSEIVVTGTRVRGAVVTDLPPVAELTAQDVEGYGAESLDELLTLLAPDVGSARGRGSGRPVILLNGRRISGFRELRDIAPEAVERVQIFPEELALQYGYRPDQRVVNIILKANYASAFVDTEYGQPFAGGRGRYEVSTNLTRIGQNGRFVANIEYEHANRLSEAERDITVEPGAINETAFRTLLPDYDRMEFGATWSRSLSETTELSLNGNYQIEDLNGFVGLPQAEFAVPGTSPFAPGGVDTTVARAFPGLGPLTREQQVGTLEGSASLTGQWDGGWRWSVTSNYSNILTRTETERRIDSAALAADVAAGIADPFAADFGSGLAIGAPDVSRGRSQASTSLATLSGQPFDLPAGPVTMTLRAGLNLNWLDSRTRLSTGITEGSLHRRDVNGAVNIDLPIADADSDVLPFLGRLSINGNVGYAELSDFGGLVEFGAGLNWSPIAEVTLIASYIGDETAPAITDLGNPVIVTPDVSVYDFTRGEATRVSVIGGGNPLLPAESKRDVRLALNWEADSVADGLRFETEYLRNRSQGVTSAFPLLTPEIEAAFPDRVVRGPDGTLVSIDRRPVAFDRVASDRIRTSIRYRGRIGGDSDRGGGEGGGPGAGRGEGGGGGPAARFLPGGGGPRGGRWNVSLSHTYRLLEEVTIGPGIPTLDLLDGSATGSNGGAARHSIELEGGAFYKGFGFRLNGSYTGPSRVDGDPATGSSDLAFSDLVTVNLRAFVNFDQQASVVEAIPLLKGARLTFRIDNIFDDIQSVTDANGTVPVAYQPGFLDPLGRTFEIDFRKRF